MAINLAAKASPKVVERFKIKSCTEGIFSSSYDWTGVRTVKVYSVDTLPLNDYDITKTDGSRFGSLTEVGDTVQEMTVTDDKSFNGVVDKGNDTSQLQIKAASKVLKRQTDEVIIPYVDKYRLQKLADGAGLKGGSVSLTTANALKTILNAGATMSNNLVPKSNRVLYIGETQAINIKLADQVVGVDKLAEKVIVNGVIGAIDGMQVRIVPDSYMPTDVVFMIVTKNCACAPKKIETYRILNEHPDVDGHVIQGRFMHDCFVFDTKKTGIYVASSKAVS
jgi:hypothetical protein